MREAQREGREIEDEPDPGKARDAARARDIAQAELVQIYRDFKKARRLDQLEPDTRFFVEELIRANGGKLPRLRLPPGRPRNDHEKMLIHLAMRQELEERGSGRGNVSKAIAAVASRYGKSKEVVREIFYNRHPAWEEAVRLSIALRHVWTDGASCPPPPEIQGQEITPKQFAEYSALAAAECPDGMTFEDNLELRGFVRRACFRAN